MERARVITDPELLPAVITENLRLCTPALSLGRLALEDADVGGQHIAAGDRLLLCYGAATRDERVLARIPDSRVDPAGVERYPAVPVVNGVVGMPAVFTPSAAVGAALPSVGPPLPDKVKV